MNIVVIAIACLMITGVLVNMGFCVAVYFSFDRLLRIEYLKHRAQWELDGSPIGFMWVPPGAKTFAGGMARSLVVSAWASAKPSWIEGDVEAAKAYAEFNRLSRFSNRIALTYLGALASVAIIFYLSR